MQMRRKYEGGRRGCGGKVREWRWERRRKVKRKLKRKKIVLDIYKEKGKNTQKDYERYESREARKKWRERRDNKEGLKA